MAISQSRLESLLADSPVFQARVAPILASVAAGVLSEPAATAHHAERVNYAKLVLRNPKGEAFTAAIYLAQSTNVVAGGITMEDEGVRAGVADAALLSQISGDFNKLAGIDLGT